uniref:Amino acid transporter transmembrane domain-containing protein n=1 Tax=Alexandrium monilatum TaxID=311494 RepID=A0A7S4Q821_9DINO|mmetsp:Transcript_42954/g.135032  ORF Transcript_42954/g.135032 Transcript_42954/m.135032 type:complete len:462 (+) Transcript_42954:100-1485(+)
MEAVAENGQPCAPLLPTSDRASGSACGGSGTVLACLHAATTVISAGTFALPWAFKQLGPALGPLALVLAGVLSRCALEDLVCVKGSAGCGPCGLPRRRTRSQREAIARGVALLPPGLVELTSEVLGSLAGCLTRWLLVLRDVGVVAAHATLAAAPLRLLVEEAAACDAARGGTLLAASKPTWGLELHRVCGLPPSLWLAPVLLMAQLLSCLNPTFLACLYAVGVATLSVAALALAVVGAMMWPEDMPMQSFWQLPLSSEAAIESLGVATFIYCAQFRVLPPLRDGMARPRRFSCIASAVFCTTGLAGIAVGLAGGPLLDAALGKESALPEEFLLAARGVRWLLCGGNMALCPSMLAPAVEQTRRSATGCPRWAVSLILLGLASGVAQLGSLGQVVSFSGGTMHCLASLVLPPALAVWALPWQSTAQTARRAILVILGMAIAVGTARAASLMLEHAVPGQLA